MSGHELYTHLKGVSCNLRAEFSGSYSSIDESGSPL